MRIDDRTVSRMHARITSGIEGPLIEDAGSSYGTQPSGGPLTEPTLLHAGVTIRLGDVAIRVESDVPSDAHASTEATPRGRGLASGAGETIVMPLDATLLGLRPAAAHGPAVDGALRPRVRSGWALKRLGAEEGEERFVLRDLRGGSFLRMEAKDAPLFKLLDGERSVTELLGEAELLEGPDGPGRLAQLIADLADRGLLEGIPAAAAAAQSREQASTDPEAARSPGALGGRLLRTRLPSLGSGLLLAGGGDILSVVRARGVRRVCPPSGARVALHSSLPVSRRSARLCSSSGASRW